MPLPAFLPSAPLSLASPLSTHSRCSPVRMKLEIGTRVRVNCSVIMYHYPGKRNEPTDTDGFEGVIIKDISVTKEVPMSATLPYIVDFKESHPKFKAHFEEDELDVIAQPDE